MRCPPADTCPSRSRRDRAVVQGALFVFLIGLALASTANAVVVFSEDFEGIALDTDPLALTTETAGSSFTAAVAVNSVSMASVGSDSAEYFGLGTDNQY